MLRLFVGIDLPPETKLALSVAAQGLPGVKWVEPGNYHVTLRFIGEVDEGVAADIDEALAEVRARRFALSIAGVNLFGSEDKPRVLYAGVDRSAPLVELRDKVGQALNRAGLPPEGRHFTPHVTLANIRDGRPVHLGRYLEGNNLLRLPPFPVERFQLVQSYLTKAGSLYEAAAEYPLV
ncbi:RNA 2',3'-cyclic phosphodiesterase [Aliidongia dinghuensis]|uniref:RNA 2',3'-cyclic phosphodiesterase n=1 Tax=Aliidongia dinghuensis TaxID=1867774 RepID=A0A8J2YW85_9PROT|nr:RNA 2',3'-cyclic phosphodiesterase [Aliidongia dinghuensis]GGF30603.1 RNA 2',3'-cyclic phosphodiesterase [Aliidongia dinghuensis]